MQHDNDERDVRPPSGPEPTPEIVDEQQIDEDAVEPEAISPASSSAESSEPPAGPPPQRVDATSRDSGAPEPPEAREEIVPSVEVAELQSGGEVARIELPTELDISPSMRPPGATDDRQSHLLPLEGGDEPDGEPNPLDQVFPPSLRPPSNTSGALRAPESRPADGPPADRGETMPRVQVLVTLLQDRTMYAEAIDEAMDRKAPKYREIARDEAAHKLWEQENKRRAADWRLRGP